MNSRDDLKDGEKKIEAFLTQQLTTNKSNDFRSIIKTTKGVDLVHPL